jgi:RAQPRD family integrative conjugative element protein
MRQRGTATTDRLCTLAIALAAGLSVCLPTWAADTALESIQLATLVRQLDTVDREAQLNAEHPSTSGGRYHFDYARLHADIARIRAGIQDYLSPPRAQPRDPQALNGRYRSDEYAKP